MVESAILGVFVGAACSAGFVAVKRIAGNCGHSDEWWYLWAIAILGLALAFNTLPTILFA